MCAELARPPLNKHLCISRIGGAEFVGSCGSREASSAKPLRPCSAGTRVCPCWTSPGRRAEGAAGRLELEIGNRSTTTISR